MQCKFCNAENAKDAVYCQDCGKRLDGKVECPVCRKFTNEAKYCSYCGARIDGKKVCKSCGTEYEGAFCPNCGEKQPVKATPVQSKRAEGEVTASSAGGWKKILNVISTSLLLTAVVASLIFVFFIGVTADGIESVGSLVGSANLSAETGIFDYFGKAYDNIDAILKTDYVMVGAAGIIPIILGTLVAAATLITVVILAIISIVKLVNKLLGKQDVKNAGKYSLAAVFAYICGAAAMSAINYASVSARSQSYPAENISIFTSFNGATVAGVVIALVFLGCAVACKIATMGKTLAEKPTIIKLSFTAAAIVLLAVALSFASQSAASLEMSQNGTKVSAGLFASGLAAMVAGSFRQPSASVASQVYASFSLFTVAQAVELALLVLICAVLVSKLKNVGKTSENGKLSLSIAALALSVVYLIFSTVGVSLYVEALNTIGSSQPITFSFTAPIVTLVFCLLNLIADVVFISMKKQSASAEPNQPLTAE